MTGYFHECPRCNTMTPLDPNDLLHHATRPDISCYNCGDEGCRTCMPEELCSECAEYEWDGDPDSLEETYLNDQGD